MNTNDSKFPLCERRHKRHPVYGKLSESLKEVAELPEVLEQARKATIRIELELSRLEAIVRAVRRQTDLEQRARIQ